MLNIAYYDTPIGRLGIAAEGDAITHICFPTDAIEAREGETPVIQKASEQLMEYFDGKRKTFDVPMAPRGTPFQQNAWRALVDVPYGETRTYGQVAESLGGIKMARAVGMANNRNPIPIFIPCHRVVGADGALTGYRGGLWMKEKLLALEHANQSR